MSPHHENLNFITFHLSRQSAPGALAHSAGSGCGLVLGPQAA